MKKIKYLITAHPYVEQTGYINIPDNVDNPKDYIYEHWDEIKFEDPYLDYMDTEIDYEPV